MMGMVDINVLTNLNLHIINMVYTIIYIIMYNVLIAYVLNIGRYKIYISTIMLELVETG